MCPTIALFCFAAWQPHTIALEAIADSLIVADAVQTAEIDNSGHLHQPPYMTGERDGHPVIVIPEFTYREVETDAIIGHHPKPASVALFFGGMTFGHVLLTNALDKTSPRWADAIDGLTIGWEGSTVAANVRLGIRW